MMNTNAARAHIIQALLPKIKGARKRYYDRKREGLTSPATCYVSRADVRAICALCGVPERDYHGG